MTAGKRPRACVRRYARGLPWGWMEVRIFSFRFMSCIRNSFFEHEDVQRGVRDEFFDFIKGYAMWIVVFGHTLGMYNSEGSAIDLGNAITMFHMPLFMVVSGYFFYPSVTRHKCWEFIRGKFIHLYLPSLCWGVFSAVLIGANKIMKHKELDPEYFFGLITTGLWFLTVLFFLSVIGALIEKRFKGQAVAVAWFVVYATIYITPPTA